MAHAVHVVRHSKLRHPQRSKYEVAAALLAFLTGCFDPARLVAADEHSRYPAAVQKQDQDSLSGMEGVVTFRGDVPLARVADESGQHRVLLQVDRKTQGLRYAVVYVKTVGAREEGQHAVPADVRLQEPVVIDQRAYTFVPHLLAVQSGQPVRFTNSDPANHNVRAIALDKP